MKTAAEKVAVMKAWEAGEVIVPRRKLGGESTADLLASQRRGEPVWNWEWYDYDVKPKESVVYIRLFLLKLGGGVHPYMRTAKTEDAKQRVEARVEAYPEFAGWLSMWHRYTISL